MLGVDFIGELVADVAAYLWPWNVILVGAYLAFWCGSLARRLRAMWTFHALAQVLFVLFGVVVGLWPMFAFNLLILITQLHRLLELRRTSTRPVNTSPTSTRPSNTGTTTTGTTSTGRASERTTNGRARPPLVTGRLSTLVEGGRVNGTYEFQNADRYCCECEQENRLLKRLLADAVLDWARTTEGVGHQPSPILR